MKSEYTWKDLEIRFSELCPLMKHARLDARWGSLPTSFSVVGCDDFNVLERFRLLSIVAGQKLSGVVDKLGIGEKEELLINDNPYVLWLKALKMFSGSFKTDYVGEQIGMGAVFTGRLYGIAEASANLCLKLSSAFIDGTSEQTSRGKKMTRRTKIPQESKKRAELQKEIGSVCPFCSNEDVGHFTIHHIDGNPSNHELSNLLLVCPTCHSKITKGDIGFDEVKAKKTSTNLRSRRESRALERERASQSIVGNNNLQVGGNLIISSKQTKRYILPPPETIGSDPLLKKRITELFNKIGEEREKRFGKSAYGVMYRNFKKDFAIKHQAWTAIWLWPKPMADSIIEYLESKYANTKSGRIENVFAAPARIPARGYLYKRETELLEQIGLKIDSPEVKEWLKMYFGVLSHAKLSQMEHWLFVTHLETAVKKSIGE